jgi:hypothetical protein
MEDHWEVYPCHMGEHEAFVSYNHGAKDEIDAFPAPTFVKVRAAIRAPDDRGLPTRAEFDALCSLEDRLESFIAESEGLFVGRVTVDGARYFHAYVKLPEEDVAAFVKALGEESGYDLRCVCRPDPERTGYWQDLFPSEAEWQLIQDMKVVRHLEENGDSLAQSRRVDHWAYFDSAEARDAFAEWVVAQGYQIGKDCLPSEKSPQHGVQFFHSCAPRPFAINEHTAALRAKAAELGGDYDGWETAVIKDSGGGAE